MTTEKSTHHGWDEPVFPSNNIDTELKALWSQMDVDTLLRGTKSNRPSAGTQGRVYLAHDEPGWYYDDGSSWIDIGTGGGASSAKCKSLSQTHTKWDSGLSDEEIWRIDLDSGKSLEVHRLETKFKGGGTNSSFTIEIYDATNAVSIVSTSTKVTGTPVATSNSGVTILARLTNGTGSPQIASINGLFEVV